MSAIMITKRDGRKEPLDIDKIHFVVSEACKDITGVSASEVEIRSNLQFFNGITSKEIQETLIKSAADLITEDTPNYQYVAGRLINYAVRKEVYGQYEPLHLKEIIAKNIGLGLYDPDLATLYSDEEYEKINSFIRHDRDDHLVFAAMEQMRSKYLVQNRVTGRIYESPQICYIMVAATLYASYPKETRLKWIKEYYDGISQQVISLPTPIMGGIRTTQKQGSSCVVLTSDDSLDSINATSSSIVKYVSQKAGIGIHAGYIRAKGSPIRNGDAYHTGVIPFLKYFHSAVKSCCVTPETFIEIIGENGSERIQIKDVKVGDFIRTLDNQEIAFKRVTDKFETIVPQIDQRRLTFANGTTLECSNNHPIMVYKNGEVLEVLPDDLTPHHNVITSTGITSIVTIERDRSNPETYIDITVDGTHTFFAAERYDQEMILTHNSQGGIRGGAATVWMPIWHYEIEDLLVLKNSKGTEETRIRHLDYGFQFSKILYERFLNNEDITLFSPNDVPEVLKAFYEGADAFKEAYEKAERKTSIRKKKIAARELFGMFMEERKNTGRIYLQNVDNVNTQGPYDPTVDPVIQSNLCAEIDIPSSPLTDINGDDGLIGLCSLSAINWGSPLIKTPKDFEHYATLAIRGLDALLDYQDYPVKAARRHTEYFRPLGVGIINFAYWLAKNDLTYQNITPEGLEKIDEWAEAWSYYLIKASVELAKEKGPAQQSHRTKYGQGLVPIDTRKKDIDQLVPYKERMDWDSLRADLKEYGIRNTTTMALMPSETSALIANATNGIEPVRAYITKKGDGGTQKVQVVPEFRKLKNKYDLLWNQKSPEGYLKIMAVLQKYIDQGISVNTSYNPEFYPDEKIPMSVLMGHILMFYKYGGKQLYYNNTYDGQGEIEVTPADLPQSPEILDADCDACVI